jgi:hypothetical protein
MASDQTLTYVRSLWGRWRWVLTDMHGQVLGKSCRSFKDKAACMMNVMEHERMGSANRRMEKH